MLHEINDQLIRLLPYPMHESPAVTAIMKSIAGTLAPTFEYLIENTKANDRKNHRLRKTRRRK